MDKRDKCCLTKVSAMVSLRKSLTVSLLIPMFFSGVGAQDWGVYYYPNSICALKGSTVTMGCTYTYPTRYTVQNKFWTKSWPVGGSEPTGLSGDSQYIGDTQQDCSLRLKNITAQDKGVYYFRFLTDKGGKWQGKGGVDLSVTDLQVEVPERVIEGDNVTLICKTTCSLTVGTIFTWYRNGTPLSSRTDQLYLQSVSREDAGSYHCAVVGQKLSPEVTLNVLYGPKNITVSISPSGEIVEGNSVTLTCSSDANPPVQKYTWFKGTSLVATGETFTIKNISSENSGGYKCRSSNEQGEKYSDTVTLNVLYPPKNVSASISPSGEIVEGSSVNLTCSSDGNPSVQNYIWFKKVDKEVLQKWTNQIYSITNISSDDCGEYQCIATNTHGSRSSEYKSINVSYAPKNVLVSSSETLNGSMMTLTCSCDANPPVQNYTWFKEGEGSPVGSGHSYSAVQSGSYYCVAQNTYGSRIAAAKMVTLNVLYGPKIVSVSISPSGKIVEGSSVTLTCSSDGNPPVQNYTWFKETSLVATGETFTMTNISSVNSGGYKCRSSNEHGEKYSDTVTLNVLYPPKRVSVSISPSGEIVEGSSVTLTCSSDGNPPVQKYTWFKKVDKEVLQKWTNQIYSITNIRSADSGEYQCIANNTQGSRSSGYKSLAVLYGPKNVSVSISPSGEIVEGSSVTLTCSSDGNPPVEYNWFKGTSLVATGETFTMKNISSVNSGGYKCRSSNEHGEKSSDTVTLDVLYPPKSVSVSISPSGEIVEGSSVTLTCSSDGNPPVQKFTWFKKVDKEVVQKWTNQMYSITNIRSADSGEYQCMAANTQGSRSSEYKSLTVLYGPKSISVSISPSGEIVEGSSVTLTCSSDGNPPVQNYTWFKGTSLVATGETFTMKKLSSVNSGGYKCKSSNEHGEKSSDTVTLDVLYPQKSISVSITFSGETLEGSSVTLTCSCDANPPVQKYTWFKEGGSSSVGSGHSYSFTLDSKSSGWYYCEAQHEHGSKRSSAVPVTLQECSMVLCVGVAVGLCGIAAIMAVVFLTWNKKKKRKVEEHDHQNADPNAQDDTYTALHPMSRSSDDVYNTLATVDSRPADDVYTALDPQCRSPEYDTLATVRKQH
ncbi:B-cell receptor CD22-like [Salminus brasiliensis]|uniref:B-cell receptor CD22-like n=1 Tax=Salminus brasiliensis TaxID=930266 RepID=UPI003B82E7A1